MSCKHSIKTVSKTYNYDCCTVVYLEIPIGISLRLWIVVLHPRNINEALQEGTGSARSVISLKTSPLKSLTYFQPLTISNCKPWKFKLIQRPATCRQLETIKYMCNEIEKSKESFFITWTFDSKSKNLYKQNNNTLILLNGLEIYLI